MTSRSQLQSWAKKLADANQIAINPTIASIIEEIRNESKASNPMKYNNYTKQPSYPERVGSVSSKSYHRNYLANAFINFCETTKRSHENSTKKSLH